MKSRYIAVILLLCGSFVGTITFADTARNTSQPGQAIAKTSHFVAASATVLQGEMTQEKRDELTDLFDEIATEIQKLKGTAPWRKPRPDPASAESLKKVLRLAIEKVGPELVAAVLFDAPQDDYVRQSAFIVLLRYEGERVSNGRSVPSYKRYTMKELPLLCKVLNFLNDAKDSMPMSYRSWLTPRTQRVKIAEWIGEVIGIDVGPKIDDDTGPLTTNVAGANPKLWLKNVLTHALTLERNKEHEAVIRGCLDTLK